MKFNLNHTLVEIKYKHNNIHIINQFNNNNMVFNNNLMDNLMVNLMVNLLDKHTGSNQLLVNLMANQNQVKK